MPEKHIIIFWAIISGQDDNLCRVIKGMNGLNSALNTLFTNSYMILVKKFHHAETNNLILQLQELRGNIRVFCRCRRDDSVQCCLKFPTDTDVLPPGVKKPFRFDKVFTPDSTQEEVIIYVPLISSLYRYLVRANRCMENPSAVIFLSVNEFMVC